jgi:hypothetical protein
MPVKYWLIGTRARQADSTRHNPICSVRLRTIIGGSPIRKCLGSLDFLKTGAPGTPVTGTVTKAHMGVSPSESIPPADFTESGIPGAAQ